MLIIDMEKKASFWDILAWVVLGLILLWLILKVAGVISTPDLLTYAPLFGVIYLAGWAMHKLDVAVRDIKELKYFKDRTIEEIHRIKERCIRNHQK